MSGDGLATYGAPPLPLQVVSSLPAGLASVNGLYLPGYGQMASGTSLDSWADAVGVGPAWSFLGTGRPTITPGAINGQAAPLFDGLDDSGSLVGAALNWSKGVTGLTLMAVPKTVAAATTTGVAWRLSTNTGASTTRCGMNRDTTPGQITATGRRLDADSVATLDGGVSSTVVFSIDVAVYDFAAAKLYLYQNGTQISGSPLDPFQTAGSTTNLASLAVTMGANGAGSNFFHGYIAAAGCFVGAFTEAQVVAMTRPLGRAFGITTA